LIGAGKFFVSNFNTEIIAVPLHLRYHFVKIQITAVYSKEIIEVKPKCRIVVKRGVLNVPLKVEDVFLIYTENKVVYVLDSSGNKYISDKSLTDMEEELNPSVFYRASRQYIINILFIKGYRSIYKSKVEVVLSVATEHKIIISQLEAASFKKWITEN
jgi:DNA-binding LytR/AlgR family response regulator